MRTCMTMWLSILLVVTAVLGISCHNDPKPMLKLVHNTYSPTGTHSVQPALTKELNHHRAERDFSSQSFKRRFHRDVPASSYFFPPSIGAASGFPPKTNVEITKQTEETHYNGTFTYSFETGNGISVEAKGYTKTLSNGMMVLVMEGQYSYTAPDGTPITTRWYADETGFHAEGAHLPGSTGRT